MIDWAFVVNTSALIVSPIAGVVTALVASARTRKTDVAKVHVAEGDNQTKLFSVLIEGFTEQVRLVNLRNETLTAQVNALEKKNDELEERLNQRDMLKDTMLAHIGELEKMVPNPPGPPPRPFTNI